MSAVPTVDVDVVDVGVVVVVVDVEDVVVDVEEVDCVLVDVVVCEVTVAVSSGPQLTVEIKNMKAAAKTHCLVCFVFCIIPYGVSTVLGCVNENGRHRIGTF